ncbi:hypothetical protein ACFSHT_00090 [Paraburkholderia silviterrae]|uniref:Uncharacterized protein n=1 Tax=Paraburkholderia silviterrae TaxID=2528715 RepID=A0A4R5MFI3_9BURK|nr:hypothetical protein [Paraburkholderia silviterrae]TDG26029.1 hypothetical protein EYW47_01310 [Paraburkholderia silviterrae]
MKLEDRMRQSIRRRRGNVVLRTDVAGLGSQSQVTHALGVLVRNGELLRLGSGIYAKAGRDTSTHQVHPLVDFESLAREALQKLGVSGLSHLVRDYPGGSASGGALQEWVLETGKRRISRKLSLDGKTIALLGAQAGTGQRHAEPACLPLQLPTSGVARFVLDLAKQLEVAYEPHPMDRWAETVTRLAGDEVNPDSTADLLVALKRCGKLSTDEMATLMVNHLRERKQRVRPV